VKTSDKKKELTSLRDRLKVLDETLLATLRQREAIAKEIAKIKLDLQLAIEQPDVWKATVKTRGTQAESLGLRAAFVEDLFSKIHEESVRIQQQEIARIK